MSVRLAKLILVFWLTIIFSPYTLGEKLVYAVSDFPPWTIWSDDLVGSGGVKGIDVDIVNALAEKLGLTVEVVRCPWIRCLTLLENGEADITGSLLRRSEREEYLHYFMPPYLAPSYCVFYVRKGERDSIRDYEDLYGGMRVGVSRGARYFPRFDQDSRINREVVTSNDQLLPMLALNRIHTFVVEEDVGDYLIANNGYSGKFEKASYRYSFSRYGYFALSKKSLYIERADEFRVILKEMIDAGLVDELRKKYIQPVEMSN